MRLSSSLLSSPLSSTLPNNNPPIKPTVKAAVDSNFIPTRRKGRRIWRIHSHHHHHHSHALMAEPCISCTTFNILAPIYKRLDKENQSCRESEYRAYWLSRNQSILDRLLFDRSSIICLQEFWVGSEELVDIYEKRLGDAGYINFKLARTNNRGDGNVM